MKNGKSLAMKVEDSKYDEWAVKDALRTLQEAQRIMKDDKMMKMVEKEADKQVQEIKSIDELREVLANKEMDD